AGLGSARGAGAGVQPARRRTAGGPRGVRRAGPDRRGAPGGLRRGAHPRGGETWLPARTGPGGQPAAGGHRGHRDRRRGAHRGGTAPGAAGAAGIIPAMFTKLTERLTKAVDTLRGRGRLTEDNIAETLREVRMALLEADVALP